MTRAELERFAEKIIDYRDTVKNCLAILEDQKCTDREKIGACKVLLKYTLESK